MKAVDRQFFAPMVERAGQIVASETGMGSCCSLVGWLQVVAEDPCLGLPGDPCGSTTPTERSDIAESSPVVASPESGTSPEGSRAARTRWRTNHGC